MLLRSTCPGHRLGYAPMSLSMHLAALLPDPRVRRARTQLGISRTTSSVTTTPPEPPHELRQHYAVSTTELDSFTIYSVAPMMFGDPSSSSRNEASGNTGVSAVTDTTDPSLHYDPHAEAIDELRPAQAANRAVLYIPGGDFADTITPASWDFVGQLVDADLRVDIPIAGRLPEYTARDAAPVIQRAYRNLVTDHGSRNITVIADGSGAALALGALLSFLPDAPPSHLILIDPWYDLSPQVWREDKLGRVASYLKKVGAAWAAGELNNPKINPGVMDHRELTQWQGTSAHIFVGGHTQPLRDARQLTEDFRDAGVPVDLTEVEGTVYLYHLRRTTEGRRDRKEMTRIAQGKL